MFFLKSKSKKTNLIIISVFMAGILIAFSQDNFSQPDNNHNLNKQDVILMGHGRCFNFFNIFHVTGIGDGIKGNTESHWAWREPKLNRK